jgi:sec-independent protein translocase protein TatC
MFFICFALAKHIYNILVQPYVWAVGSAQKAQMIYTHALEFLFTQIQVAVFGAAFLAFPVIATQIYKFVAPGLYRNERQAFMPYLVATRSCSSSARSCLLHRDAARHELLVRDAAARHGDGDPQIQFLPKVNEYLSLS